MTTNPALTSHLYGDGEAPKIAEALARIHDELAIKDRMSTGPNLRSLVDPEDVTVTVNRQALDIVLAALTAQVQS